MISKTVIWCWDVIELRGHDADFWSVQVFSTHKCQRKMKAVKYGPQLWCDYSSEIFVAFPLTSTFKVPSPAWMILKLQPYKQVIPDWFWTKKTQSDGIRG